MINPTSTGKILWHYLFIYFFALGKCHKHDYRYRYLYNKIKKIKKIKIKIDYMDRPLNNTRSLTKFIFVYIVICRLTNLGSNNSSYVIFGTSLLSNVTWLPQNSKKDKLWVSIPSLTVLRAC
jgi:hypothetical protein